MSHTTVEHDAYMRGYHAGVSTLQGPGCIGTFFSFWGIALFFLSLAAAFPIIGYYLGLWYNYWGF